MLTAVVPGIGSIEQRPLSPSFFRQGYGQREQAPFARARLPPRPLRWAIVKSHAAQGHSGSTGMKNSAPELKCQLSVRRESGTDGKFGACSGGNSLSLSLPGMGTSHRPRASLAHPIILIRYRGVTNEH